MPWVDVRGRPADLGWLAAAIGIGSGIGLVVLRQANMSDLEPGPTVEASVGWLVFWSGPAIVGAIGTAVRRREIVVGAGLSYVWMAALSFSGVTLILLAPAVVFLYAGLRSPGRGAADRRPDQPVLVGAILALLAGSFVGLFGTLQTVCWERSIDGSVRTYPAVIDDNVTEGSVGTDVAASGCSEGQVSPLGTAIVVVCVSGAAGLAIRARSREPGAAVAIGID